MDKYLVGIGASAGGLDPIKSFIRSVEKNDTVVSFIIAQHLSPDHASILSDLISKETDLVVKEAEHMDDIEPYTVYITPPGHHITVVKNHIELHSQKVKDGPIPSVDKLFESIANYYKKNAFALVLSGTGTDGAKGLAAIKEKGGICIVQSPNTAKYDGMPNQAIRSGFSDYTAPVEDMWDVINKVVEEGVEEESRTFATSEDEQIFKRLQSVKKVNFDQYKLSTVLRRINKHMSTLGIKNKNKYLERLSDPEVVNDLFNTILIGFTYFFRDADHFKLLEAELDTYLSVHSNEQIRVWVPGCASGEEAYSIAILLKNILKKKKDKRQVQIFATDIDEVSIEKARKGIFGKLSMEEVPEKILNQYFIVSGDQYEVKKEIRSMILFSKHDITQDPHFLKLDLISCRNLLIYLKKEIQDQLIPSFHHCLNDKGLLSLGSSENVKSFTTLFKRVNTGSKIFVKKHNPNQKRRMLNKYRSKQVVPVPPSRRKFSIEESIANTLLRHNEETLIVVDENAEIIKIKGKTDKILKVPQGAPKTDLFNLAEDRLNIELRRLLDKAKLNKDMVQSTMKPMMIGGDRLEVSCKVYLLEDEYTEQNLYLFAIRLTDLPPIKSSLNGDSKESEISKEDKLNRIRELEEELLITREYLQNYVEELETANEELQSMNEELQSTNEELQSSNEELETSNEELQSTSEEMQTAYRELNQLNKELETKEYDLKSAKENMSSLLNNSLQAFLLFDIQGNLVEYNEESYKMIDKWGVEKLEKGDHYSNFIPSSVIEIINETFKKALKGNNVKDSFVIRTQPNNLHYEFGFTPVIGMDGRVDALSLGILDFSKYYRLQEKIKSNQQLIDSVFKNVNIGVFIADDKGVIRRINDKFSDIFGFGTKDIVGQPFTQIIPTQNRMQALNLFNEFLSGEGKWPTSWKMATKQGHIIDTDTNSSMITESDGSKLVIVTAQDVTDTLKYKTILEEAGHAAKLGGWEYDIHNDRLEWTDETYEIYGMKPGSPIDLEIAKGCYTKEAIDKLESRIQEAIATGSPYDLILAFESIDGKSKWIRTTCKPITDNGYTVKLLGTIQDVSKLKEAELELKKLSLVATKALNSIIITDGRGYIEWANRAFVDTTGYRINEVIGKRPGDLLQGKETDPLTSYEISNALDNGKSFHGTILNYRKDGQKYWNELYITPVVDDNGITKQFISVQSDVTDRMELQQNLKASLKEKESLLKEVHHRVKNNLALVNAMLYLQESESKDPYFNKLINDTQNRIKSIASVHELIYQNESFSNIRVDNYLDKIIFEIKRGISANIENVEICTELSPIEIEVEQAIPFALICNEVITNSLKHSYPRGVEGEIKVKLNENNGRLFFEVSDDGVGLPDDFDPYTTSSLGMTLIIQFSKQLEGSFEFSNKKDRGSKFTLNFKNRADYHNF